MSEAADRFRRTATGFTERVQAVPADGWAGQSPCPDWTARDVVRHVVDTCGLFYRLVGRPVPPGPSVDDDPAGAWAAARDGVLAGLDDPDIADLEYESRSGRGTFASGIATFVCSDVLVHTWDLARAAGLDDRLDPQSVREVFETVRPMDEKMRVGGSFGPKLPVPDDADEQTRLLAFVGRQA